MGCDLRECRGLHHLSRIPPWSGVTGNGLVGVHPRGHAGAHREGVLGLCGCGGSRLLCCHVAAAQAGEEKGKVLRHQRVIDYGVCVALRQTHAFWPGDSCLHAKSVKELDTFNPTWHYLR